jgi:DNA polymerase III alpha subunit (gram-positive type)
MTQPQNKLIFFDFETTGLNPYSDDVIEYSFLCNGQAIHNVVSTTQVPLTDIVVEITKITTDMVKEAPPMIEHKEAILKMLELQHPDDKQFMVAHNNNRFDRFFLQRMLRDFGTSTRELNIYFLDTMDIGKYTMPFMRSLSLKSLCKYFQLSEGTHRALSDTTALEGVYYQLVMRLAKIENKDSKELLANPQLVYDIMYV